MSESGRKDLERSISCPFRHGSSGSVGHGESQSCGCLSASQHRFAAKPAIDSFQLEVLSTTNMLQVRRHTAAAPVAPALPVRSAAAPPAAASASSFASAPASAAPTAAAPLSSSSSSSVKAKAKPPRAAPKQLDAGRIATVQGKPLDYHRLIVRNLAFDVTDAVLLQAFAPAAAADAAAATSGATLARVMTKPNGRSMGFGFVEFGSIADAQKVCTICQRTAFNWRMHCNIHYSCWCPCVTETRRATR